MNIRKIFGLVLGVTPLLLFPVFEDNRTDATARGLGQAITSLPVENGFGINPANIRKTSKIYAAIDGSYSTTAIQDTAGSAERIYFRFAPNSRLGFGAITDFLFYTYTGSFPGAQSGLLWREISISAAASFNIVEMFSVGLSLSYFNYGTGLTIHDQEAAANNGFDLGIGFLFDLEKGSIGLSAENLLGLGGDTSRAIRFGISYKKLFKVVTPILDTVFTIDESELDFLFGLRYEVAPEVFSLNAGLEALSLFSTLSPTIGFTYQIRNLDISYSSRFDLAIDNSSTHYVTVAFEIGADTPRSVAVESSREVDRLMLTLLVANERRQEEGMFPATEPKSLTETPAVTTATDQVAATNVDQSGSNLMAAPAASNVAAVKVMTPEEKYPEEFAVDHPSYTDFLKLKNQANKLFTEQNYVKSIISALRILELSSYNKLAHHYAVQIYPKLNLAQKKKIKGYLQQKVLKYRTSDRYRAGGYFKLYKKLPKPE